MKRILVLNYEFPPLGGGASPVSYEIAKRLSETGEFDIDVVTMGYNNLPVYEVVNANFRIHRVRCLRSKMEICHPWEQATYLVTGYLKAVELIKMQAYDVCHCHFIIPTGVIALRLKEKFGLPYVITAHGSDVLGYNPRFRKVYPLLIGKWKKIINGARTIVTPSEFLKGKIIKAFSGFNDQKIVVIPNGIEVSKYTPSKKRKWIFSSGRLFPNKGFQFLIKSVSDRDIGYEVHIAGDGPMMGELQGLAKKSATKIIFHGWLNNADKEYKRLVEEADIYVLASEMESFGMVVLEAMCAGCAVVTTGSSGCGELIGDAGLLVAPRSSQELNVAISQLTSDEAMLKGLQASAFKRSRLFDWNNIMLTYAKYLQI